MSYTYALLAVSPETYGEIARLLREAGYDHAFHTQQGGPPALDMHGIALTTDKDLVVWPEAVPANSLAKRQAALKEELARLFPALAEGDGRVPISDKDREFLERRDLPKGFTQPTAPAEPAPARFEDDNAD